MKFNTQYWKNQENLFSEAYKILVDNNFLELPSGKILIKLGYDDFTYASSLLWGGVNAVKESIVSIVVAEIKKPTERQRLQHFLGDTKPVDEEASKKLFRQQIIQQIAASHINFGSGAAMGLPNPNAGAAPSKGAYSGKSNQTAGRAFRTRHSSKGANPGSYIPQNPQGYTKGAAAPVSDPGASKTPLKKIIEQIMKELNKAKKQILRRSDPNIVQNSDFFDPDFDENWFGNHNLD